MRRSVVVLSSVLALASLAGCATAPSANTYVRSSVMSEMDVQLATVVSVRRVKIENPNTGTGSSTGAALGAIAGSSLGGNVRDNLAGAVVGAVAAGVVGSLVERGANSMEGVEIIYQIDNGPTKVLVQALEGSEDIKPGDRIRLIRGQYSVRAVKL